jgi:hypothetical protein
VKSEAKETKIMRRFGHWIIGCALLTGIFLSPYDNEGTWCSRINIALAETEEEANGATISKLKVEPLYRAAVLTWKVGGNHGGPVTFEIYRAMSGPEQEYKPVTSIRQDLNERKYKYVDKNLPVEENYFYKIMIPETRESFGPLQVRPPFSLPTT